MSTPTPEALFDRYREDGDAQSLAALFDQTAPEVYRVACYLSGDPSEAEDLLQSTFLVAIERADSFRPGARVVPWLLGILANKARRLQEQRLREQRKRTDAAGHPEAPPAQDPVAAAQDRELRACLERELSRLTSSLRPVLVLHLQHGVGAAEIARILDRPAGTVRSQISRGMEILRQALPPGLAGLGAVALTPPAISAAALQEIRSVVLARATEAALPATAVSAAVAALLALVMNTKIVLSTMTATLVGIALLVWGPSELGGDVVPGRAGVPVGTLTGDVDLHAGGDEQADIREVIPSSGVLPGEGVLVKIVAKDSGEAVAGAGILHAPESFSWPGTNQLILEGAGGSFESELRRVGRMVVTDANGLARLPYYLVEWCTCCVRKGDLYGWLDVARPEDPDMPQVVAIGRDRWIEVRVVDESGHPRPSVPVGIRTQEHCGASYAGMSEADAVLRLKHLQIYNVPRDVTGRRMFWVVPFCLGAAEGVAVDLDALPNEPVALHYPPTGSLRIQLLDSRGRSWGQGFSSSGQPAPRSALQVWVFSLGPGDRTVEPMFKADAEGRCVVPFVVLGQKFHVQVGGQPFSLGRQVQGPERPGQRVQVELRAPRPQATLIGRLLYPCREPAANKTFHLGCRGSPRQMFETDAAGGFRVDLHDTPWDDPAGDQVTCYFVENDAQGEHHFAQATIPRPGTTAEPAEVELGALVLAPTPLLVAGWITGTRKWDRPMVSVGLKRVNGSLLQLPPPVTLRLPGGRYEVRGFAEQTEHVLYVDCDGYVRQEIPFIPGTRSLDVGLLAAADIEVEVRHAKDASSQSFAVRLVPDDRTRARIATLGSLVRGAAQALHPEEAGLGSACWPDTVPGTYRLDCFCVGWSTPILQIEGIQVKGGGQCKDPRLKGIDLTERARAVTLTVLDANGQPVSSGRAHVWSNSASAPRLTPSISEGGLRLALPETSVDLLVHAPGCRAQLVPQVTGDRTVRLQPGITVRVKLGGRLPALGPEERLSLSALVDPTTTPFAARGGTWAVAGIFYPESVERPGAGDFTLTLPTPGRYALALTLHPGRSVRKTSLPIEPAKVEITDGDGQVFELALSK